MLLDEIARRLYQQQPHDSDVAAALVSVKEAQTRRGELAAEDFVSFVDQWLRDLVGWRARLAELRGVDSVAKALAALGLSRVVLTDDPEPRESPDPEPEKLPKAGALRPTAAVSGS
jgi:hypothetical protein